MKEKIFPGTLLRERRQAMGFSIEGARARTHVPAHCLKGFETGDFSQMPGQAFAVGFLRSYCRFLDLDPEPFVDEYLFCTRPEEPVRRFNFVKHEEKPDAVARAHPYWINEIIAWGAVCALVLLGWLSYTALIRPIAETVRIEAGTPEIEPPVHFQEDF